MAKKTVVQLKKQFLKDNKAFNNAVNEHRVQGHRISSVSGLKGLKGLGKRKKLATPTQLKNLTARKERSWQNLQNAVKKERR